MNLSVINRLSRCILRYRITADKYASRDDKYASRDIITVSSYAAGIHHRAKVDITHRVPQGTHHSKVDRGKKN